MIEDERVEVFVVENNGWFEISGTLVDVLSFYHFRIPAIPPAVPPSRSPAFPLSPFLRLNPSSAVLSIYRLVRPPAPFLTTFF